MARERFKLSEIKKLNPEMFGILTDHNDAIALAMAKINSVIPFGIKIEMDYFFDIIRADNTDYLNDGNTETKGYTWSAYWAFPLNGHKKDEYSVSSIDNQYCPESIVFTLSDFHERCSDKRISGCKFFSLYFNYGAYPDIIYLRDRGNADKSVRLDYLNNNYQSMAILKVENYAKIVECLKRLNTAIETCNLFK